MSKKALTVILSVIIIGVVLAGLQGTLNWLAGTSPLDIEENGASVIGNVASISKNTAVNPTPQSEKNTKSNLAFEISPSGEWGEVFPSPDINIRRGLAAHLPLFYLSGNPGTPYLRTTTASIYQSGIWKSDSSAQ
ncbi:MAG TPA: hypothetical protein VLH15_06105, partial [Dehalococcoidales bacterium]|nr:hypothetical protein [Dehalococcoidales bacterium]